VTRGYVEAVFRRLTADVAGELPGFDVRFRWNPAAGDPGQRPPVPGCDTACHRRRAFAWAFLRPDATYPVVEAAPRMADQTPDRIEALARHELAHAVQLWLGVPDGDHTERGTDALAERLWGDRIYYDDDLVQTLQGGIHPRPAALGL